MKQTKPVVTVASEYIALGIEKYQGKVDANLQAVIRAAKLNYTVYAFNDGRVLLVMPGDTSAFLYKTADIMFELLSLEK